MIESPPSPSSSSSSSSSNDDEFDDDDESESSTEDPPRDRLRQHRRRLQQMVNAMNQRNAQLEEENRFLREALAGLVEINGHLKASAGTHTGSAAAMIAFRLSLYALLDRKLSQRSSQEQQLPLQMQQQQQQQQQQEREGNQQFDKSASE